MTRQRRKHLWFLGWVMLIAVACGGRPAAEPALPPGPALVMFYTDG